MNKQKTTKSNKKETINQQTGLTSTQEKSVVLLLSGKSITEVSQTLKIDRSTIYAWQKQSNFQAYFNATQERIQAELENGLMSLYEEAITTIKDCLSSDNESIKLKAALWLVEKIESKKIGETDPRTLIKNELVLDNISSGFQNFDTRDYERILKENNLQ
jgi:hypothetical protein